jgi:hypothetical protein
MITKSHVPDCLKDTTLLYIHKKGPKADLSNWRGIMHTNFLANAPLAWFNLRFAPYAKRMGIIPETQVACQSSTQQRDLTSYLSSIRSWVKRSKETVYLLKRDQMKGFDFLFPEGFYDAIAAYVLPSEIIDLNKDALADNQCHPRTVYGITLPFETTGLTRQGGASRL